MKKYRLPVAALISLMCLGGLLQTPSAQGTDSASTSTSPGLTMLGLRFSGFASMEFGQMLDPWMLTNSTAREDILRTYVNFGVTKQVTPRLRIEAAAEGKMYYNTFNQEQTSSILEGFFMPTTYYAFYMDRAFGSYSLGDVNAPFLQFTLGYFPYKYNPDARDLGEYLYRSGTYPAYILNNFDFPQARLAGLKVSSDLFGMLHQDLLLTLTTDLPPYFDMNLGYVVSFHDPNKIVDIGVGGMYQSLVPLDENLTQPKRVDNSYMKNATTDSLGNIIGDTTTQYYTAAGLKLMARFSFDIKGFFGPTILGSEDLKLYGEAAILGVQNYRSDYPKNQVNPYGYDTLMHKIPITLGFNVPTFKVLDVFTMEVEYYGCTYPSTIQTKDETVYKPVPVPPGNLTTIGDPRNYAVLDNWKWAFYAKKSFKNGIFIVGQVACDHIRNESPVNAFYDTEEILRTDRSWWWALKVGYKF
jgi:hypothetical protein